MKEVTSDAMRMRRPRERRTRPRAMSLATHVPRCNVVSTSSCAFVGSPRSLVKFQSCRLRGVSHRTPQTSIKCEFDGDEKMFVPPGAFGGTTPERQASKVLSAMLTYIACWIVIDQTETVAPSVSLPGGVESGDEDQDTPDSSNEANRAASRITSTHDFLLDFLEQNPVRDGDVFMEKLFATNPDVGRRVAETRIAYAAGDFEWHNAKSLTLQSLKDSNAKVQAELLSKTFEKSRGVSDDEGVFEEEGTPEPSKLFTPSLVNAAKDDWRKICGRTVEFKSAFANCSDVMQQRNTWVLKSLDGFVEFGMADTKTLNLHLKSINKLGEDLRQAGVLESDIAIAETGLLNAMEAEISAELGTNAWSADRQERWKLVLLTFMDAIRSDS